MTLPLSLGDGKWHHVCVTWSTRDGQWEAYQDGVQRGSGINLSPWHPIKPGGVFILGQEQVKKNRFILCLQCLQPLNAEKSMLAQIQVTNDVIFHMSLQKQTLTVLCSFSGHAGGPFRRHPVICGGDVRPAHVVTCPDSQRHLQPGHLRQPPQRGRYCLVRLGGGAPWRRLQIPL